MHTHLHSLLRMLFTTLVLPRTREQVTIIIVNGLSLHTEQPLDVAKKKKKMLLCFGIVITPNRRIFSNFTRGWTWGDGDQTQARSQAMTFLPFRRV